MPMHENLMGGWMFTATLVWLLLTVVLVLGAAALVKYLRSGPTTTKVEERENAEQ